MRNPNPILSEILERYPPGFAAVEVADPPQPGFSSALVARVRCVAGDFCLRGWPVGAVPVARILGLHRLLQHVSSAGVPETAVPLPAGDGETLVTVAGRHWQLEPWLPGRADFRDDPRDERLRAAMRCLARWHLAAATFRCTAAEAPWFATVEAGLPPGISARIERIERWHGPRQNALRAALDKAPPTSFRRLARDVLAQFQRAASRVADDLRSAANFRVPLQPCLRDVWHDHVLFAGNAVTGLIDPAACRTETVAADLARLLGSLLGDDVSRREWALGEYALHRPLRDDERRLVPLLDRGGVLLSGMTWLDRVYLRRSASPDDPRILDRLAEILGRMRDLDSGLE